MVHALGQIHGMLAANGRLIDLHPNGQPPPLFVRLGREQHAVGWIYENSDYVCYDEADAALATAVSFGWYAWDTQQTITFTTYADDLPSLQTYLDEMWHDAWIEPQVAMQIESIFSSIEPDKEILVQEVLKVARLRPL